jgi:hypothetical protein
VQEPDSVLLLITFIRAAEARTDPHDQRTAHFIANHRRHRAILNPRRRSVHGTSSRKHETSSPGKWMTRHQRQKALQAVGEDASESLATHRPPKMSLLSNSLSAS